MLMVSRTEVTGPKVSTVERAAYSIGEFCASHAISKAFYYTLRKRGLAPDEARVGDRVIITVEAAARWRREREKAGRV